jgi:hypothetical protein
VKFGLSASVELSGAWRAEVTKYENESGEAEIDDTEADPEEPAAEEPEQEERKEGEDDGNNDA